ncbi:hypothetical protein CHH28_13020 [Bacterioplanes sanyensis]|uniref:DUF6351 domain-containing protein n=1 Tax=Bacterioplanes sanyensis TaxID=1249553 RepID=A0A222FLA0_9GAMM|nr:DUF6351 family protein [Bacterioplanes sanyensis]ASP39539.1 hypothetical protein CHH28_13020 [Bacterioplanes sanyensis]
MRRKLVLLLLLALAAGSGFGYQYYLDLRQQIGLDRGYPQVAGTPPGSQLFNLPPYSGPHPATAARPDDPYSYPIEFGAIGPVEPLFSGPLQYPFACQSEESKLGQPLIDNQQGWGVPVFAENSQGKRSDLIIGYSKDCLLPTRNHYLYDPPNSALRALPKRTDQRIDDVPQNAELIVRAESGTIHRHIYVLLMPTTHQDRLLQPDLSRWNGKAIYYFRGGISIGFQQGRTDIRRVMRDMRTALRQGYAIIYSTATETDNTYNIRLQEDTALRVKRQFSARFAKPEFVIGLGGSGGGLQQFLYAQNQPGIIDGGVALIAYPDMVTQIQYTLDCEILEYYFDHLASDPSFWRQPEKRQAVMGLTVSDDYRPRLSWLTDAAYLLRGQWPPVTPPASECSKGWRGSVPLVNNPRFHSDYYRFSREVQAQTHWTHWQDNRNVYGTDQDGRSPSVWSNEGVQYGLNAVSHGDISIPQFLELNARIGSWLPAKDMDNARFWHISGDSRLYRFSPYGEHNMSHRGEAKALAPRYQGDLSAAKAAYQSGNVFVGHMHIPVMDVRMYLDHELNIHHTWAAASTRQRLLDAGTPSLMQPIWISTKPYNPMWDAVAVMDEWLSRHKITGDWATARPPLAQDRCLDEHGDTLHIGDGVWNGRWNGQSEGACHALMPFHQGSRQVAGENIGGTIFQCQRMTVSEALERGMYQPLDMTPYQNELERIFATGVCDYSAADQALPAELNNQLGTVFNAAQ